MAQRTHDVVDDPPHHVGHVAGGGRELHLRSLQPLALYAANSIFVEGYLTTPGQGTREALQMIEDMGFEVEEA